MKNVEDVYPLSPLQRLLLFHTLSSPESSAGFEQSSCVLTGELDIEAFERIWQRIVDRHPILRTAFLSEGLKEPVQVVRQKVDLPFEHQDWRALDEQEQRDRMKAHLEADRRRGFNPSRAPLMRLGLFRLADDRYFFVWSHHHLLIDGWCTTLLLKEVFALYSAFQRGEEMRLPASRPFRDYIAWLQRQDHSAAAEFWRRMFQGFSGPTPLVVDRLPRKVPEQRPAFDQRTTQLPPVATLELQRFAERSGLTLSTLIHGAWALLLSRYSQKDDVVFGTTVSGRPADITGVESMIGMFINNLPVRTKIPSAGTVRSWLRKFQELLFDLRQYEHSSPDQIRAWSGVSGVERLFETLVVFQNYPTGGTNSQEMSAERLQISSYGARLETNYPLTFLAAPGRALVMQLHFDVRRFDPETIARIAGHLRILLEGLAGSADRPVADLELLTDPERHQILRNWSPTAAETFEVPLWQRVEAVAARSPESVALKAGEEKIDYGELARRVQVLSKQLRSLVVAPHTVVAVCLPLSPDLLVTLLAIWCAEGVALPLDPSAPQGSADLLSWSEARIVVTRRGLLPDPGLAEIRWSFLEPGWHETAGTTGSNPSPRISPGDPACRICSWRDGAWEGLTVSHRALTASLAALVFRLRITDRDSVLAWSPLASGSGLLELLLPFATGARAILGDPRSGLPETGTVVMNATPSEWCRLLDGGWTPAEGARLLASGEPVALGLAERLELAGAEIWAAFGARELGVWSALGRASGDLAEAVDGATIRLLDGHGRAVPMGVPGEICVGGACLPLAYGGPAPGRERFVPDPFPPGARLFRTGELGRLLPNGRIELLGATTDMDGEARDLAEIETALRRVPGILAVAACDREPERSSRVAYLNVDRDRPFEAAAVRSFLAGSLPGVMPPSELILLDSFPLLADGRTDRSALPSPDEVTVGRQETAAPPRTALELQLVQIWERLFDRHPIGVTDSFFDLGGHSLLAARLAAEIRAHFGREVQIARLLQEPTIRRLARALEEKVQAETWSPLVPLQPLGSHPPFFCVHPAGGSALRYVALAYQLGTDYPVYGLQARGHETGQQPFDRIEEMAAFYCEAITSVRPHGPYLFGGWSFGGLVAFEMARQFLERGEEVPLIVLFDSAAGNVAWDRYQGPVPDQAEQLARVLGDELAVPVDELRQFENADEQAEHVVRQAQKRGVLPADYDVGQARRYIATLEAHGQAMRAYVPQPFPGRVVQLCATEGLITALGDPRLGWEELALGGVEVHMIPGRHQDLFRPPAVQLVGELLRSYWTDSMILSPESRRTGGSLDY